MQEGSLFTTPFPAFIVSRFFDNCHSDWCEVIPLYCMFLSKMYCNKDPEKVSHDRKPVYNESINPGKLVTFIQTIKLLVSGELVLNQLYLNGILQHIHNRSLYLFFYMIV